MAQNTAQQTNTSVLKFPYPSEEQRLKDYDYYEKLFMGDHFNAFTIKAGSEQWSREYAKLRYITCNFAGLVSKVAADLLFIESPKISVQDGDQKFLDALMSDNKLRVQNYESAIGNSYFGDAVFKVRVGLKSPKDSDSSVIIDQISPKIYFPTIDPNNVKGDPIDQELAWVVTIGDNKYLRKEIHTPGLIENQVFLLEGDNINGYEIKQREDLAILGIAGLADSQETGIDRSLLIHIPNWRPGMCHYGMSDYNDLDSVFFAINNRMTKMDNVLDKHSDPILALPEGVLDENGKVKRSALGLFVRPDGQDKTADPAYVTWDANLESAFKQIDKLVEMMFMMSETSPDVLGMGQGQAASGRALKLKLLRTLAKVGRKQLYYREGIIEALYVAQLMAKAHDVSVDGVKLTKDPVKPEVSWKTGLPVDQTEMLTDETMALDAGITSKSDAIQRVYDVEEDVAEELLKEIALENPLPVISGAPSSFGKGLNAQTPPTPGQQTAQNLGKSLTTTQLTQDVKA